MALFFARADILDINALASSSSHQGSSKQPLPSQNPLNVHEALQALFASPNNPSAEEGPAHKRRKLENGDDTITTQAEFKENESIVLAKVSMDLSIPSRPQQSSNRIDISEFSGDSHVSQTLSLEAFHVEEANTFRMALWNTALNHGIELTAQAPPEKLPPIIPHLRTATKLATTVGGKNTRPVTRAAFSRCLVVAPNFSQNIYRLYVEVRWTLGMSVVEDPRVKASSMKADLRLLSHYCQDATLEADSKWALSDFYDSVHVPPSDLKVSPCIRHNLPDTSLYPFQERAVDWLLRREGVAFSSLGDLEPLADTAPPASFRQTKDARGKTCYISQVRGMVINSLEEAQADTLQSLRGGILAEEMGLGKTVELIALMTHHKRDVTEGNYFDAYTGTYVKPSSATLIITPPSILEQWISELQTHAPELKVFHYKGLPSPSAPKRDHALAKVEHLLQYDVVLTTYLVLSKEIHHATPPPDRSFRHGKRHERRASPLVGISWWRVCLDEAQMVESGVSQAAKVAKIIPRCNAWAVSGTPLRKDVQDLRGLLIFLRCDAFANNTAVWDRLDKTSFRAIFNQLALRHTKVKIRDELRLPPQKRIVITVPFTAIEEQHYAELVRQMCDACWLTPEGNPIEEDRDTSHPEVIERMREWLVRLRQTCLHAHVGRKNRRALGAKNGALRTVHEVLEVMIEQNDTNWKSEAREMILAQVKLGHVKAYAGNVANRARTALPEYEAALEETKTYVQTCREELLLERQKLGKEAPPTAPLDDDEDEEKDCENLGRIPVLRKSLRSFLELEHVCSFFIATSYHQIKENEGVTTSDSEDFHQLEKLETDWYEKAKTIRHELLRDSKNRAQQQINKVMSRKPNNQIPEIADLPELGGIEARKILGMMDNISDFLNAQAKQLEIWRSKIVDILLMRLVDDDKNKETTGEEYDDSLKAQDELYIYIMGLRTLIADRNTAVHGLQDILVEHEIKAAEKQARRKEDDPLGRGHAPEVVLDFVSTRRKLQAQLEGGSLKGVVSGVRSLITSLQWRVDGGDSRAAAELNVVQKHFVRIQDITSQHAKIITELEKEQDMFRSTMNQRLEYYRQFQHISDTVAKWKEELDETLDQRGYAKYSALREQKKHTIAGLKTKHTYLTHLRTENMSDGKAECIICQDVIEIGVLTTCGHKYCKVCINTWWHQHRTCPLCKQKLGSSDFKDISLKPSELKAQEEIHEAGSSIPGSSPDSTSNTSIYSDISDSTMKEIKMIDLSGSYGSKIDMIARHLIWIRNNAPGARSIIFSQFGDFLEVMREALEKWKIGVSAITDKDGIAKFKADPAVECFLLDAKSDSSGLNLVNATFVFLCEPLINPAIELQAIARVHRIGQQLPTTVFMYLISDTVEEAIYDISVARRLEHIDKSRFIDDAPSGSATPMLQEKTLDAANSAQLQAAPLKQLLRKKGDGEIVQIDDLWKCLFGKQRRVAKPVLEMEVARHLRADAAEVRRTTSLMDDVRL